ncbi:carboxymuconolactone decarboxylase family protein [Thermosipho ferrireducens]|uniref:Carboxymuconolactone decarboxylase family protein n=1 Tax=Thermosipho ferrireducens TaxID=2571116 RepID=A0ABX7S7L6_9BACT|nr:carboxymuconolactone decarboxylase family protein [Thermosipho ferrireducens]QTA37622.1 carboxymuconolactone decarboxylase family protein [Thermosipho ferrireducens]
MNLKEWRKSLPEVTGGLVRMRQKALSDGEIPSKYKILMALTMSIVAKCEPCIKAYVEKSKNANVNEKEFLEALETSIMFAGCVGEQWALKAMKYWEDIKIEKDENCCSTDE